MRVRVDPDVCIGSGICVEICPEVFELNGDASTVKLDLVSPRYEEACLEAVELCPMKAISVEQ